MNPKEYEFTASEINQLEYLMSIMPQDREIERIGLERRLEKAKQRLEGVPSSALSPRMTLDFGGKPVVGDAGIDANFAGKAATVFSECMAIAIAHTTGLPSDMGSIPHRALGQQLVSGVTKGSFGFEIELPPSTPTEGEEVQTDSPAVRAVKMIQDLLEVSLEGTDEELTRLKDQMHPRAVKKAAEFLELLRTSQAQAAIGFSGREVALRDPGEVEDAANRLAGQKIRDETNTVNGTLIDILPTSRSFAFRKSDDGNYVEGRIGREISDPFRMAARYTNEEVRARICQIQVGQGEPKYTLLEVMGPVDGSPYLPPA